MTLQIDGQDPVVQLDAAISDESVPQRDQAAGLFGGVRSLEIFVHDRADRVDRRKNIAEGGLLEGRCVILEELFVGKYNVDADGGWSGRERGRIGPRT